MDGGELAELMLEPGRRDGFNLDGGGAFLARH
jgi:hypothetical protein